jgi:hypothetical protein
MLLSCIGLSIAAAATITFTALPGVQMSYNGVPNTGTYNGFWTATVDGQPGVLLFCDDATHTTPNPVSGPFNYTVSVLNGPDPLQNARWASDPFTNDELVRYRAAAILLNDLITFGSAATTNNITNFQYIIWDLFSPASTPTTAWQDAIKSAALAKASSTVTPELAAIYRRLVIYTPANGVGTQEFLGLAPVPEPSQFAALFGALALGWGLLRRRKA